MKTCHNSNRARFRRFRHFISILSVQIGSCATIGTTTVLPVSIETGGGRTVRPVVVEATSAWTVTEDIPWLSVSTAGGSGNGDFDIVVDRNDTGADRTGTVVVGDAVVTVTQRALGSGLRELWRAGRGDPSSDALPPRFDPPARANPVVLDSDVAVAAAGRRHFAFAKHDGTLWGMGYGAVGHLGTTEGAYQRAPKQIATGVREVAAGNVHTLFVKTDKSLWGIGGNLYYELGFADGDDRETPTLIRTDVEAAAGGGSHSLFVTSDGALWVMGTGLSGFQPYTDTPNYVAPVPTRVADSVRKVAAGDRHSLFIDKDGTLWSAGSNTHGQLGVAPGIDLESPAIVTSGVVAIAAGLNHSLFVKSDRTLWAMGDNSVGQLGDGTTIERTIPVLIATDVVDVAAGAYHSLFIKADGSLWSMGANWSGELGDSTPGMRAAPAQVASNVRFVAAGLGFTLFITSDDAYTPPVVTSEPGSQALAAGGRAMFTVAAAGPGTFTYQWLKDGVEIPGATGAGYSIPGVQSSHAGAYSVTITNHVGTVTSDAGMLTVEPSPRLVNISTRGPAGTGDATLIVGFVIEGTGEKTVLIRGIGPELLKHGVNNVVDDPFILLFAGNTLIDFNDNWQPQLAGDFPEAGAFPLTLGSKDAAIKTTLAPGAYTVHLANPGPVADALIEIYDHSMDAGTRLINLSSRLYMAEGQTAIVGTVVANGPMRAVVRSVGPGLEAHIDGVFMPDPRQQVYSGQTLVTSNDDWDASLSPHFASVGAFALEDGSQDAALRLELPPGNHTVHTTADGLGGIVLIELYDSK